MKILVVNLLRMGDIVLSVPTIRGLKDRYPSCEIHLLINREFEGLVPLLKDISRFHFFERSDLQKSLGEADRPIFDALDAIEDLLEELASEKFDRVVNLTQNRLSAYLCSLVPTTDMVGLVLHPKGLPSFGSPWIRFLNDRASVQDQFHFADVYQYAAGVSPNVRYNQLQETTRGREYAESLLPENTPLVMIQVLSSDSKKNWSLNQWRQALHLFATAHPDHLIGILCAPADLERIEGLELELRKSGHQVRIFVCDLEESLSLMLRSRLVVSLDTGIKHIAAAAGVRVLEISLGSSDLRQTGVYADRAVIVKSRAACAPCPHRLPCSQESHLCGQMIMPEAIALVMSEMINGTGMQLELIQSEFHDSMEIYLTRMIPAGFWMPIPVDQRLQAWTVDTLIERCARKLLLQRAHLKPISNFGEEGRRVLETLNEFLRLDQRDSWRQSLTLMETDTMGQERRLARVMGVIKRRILNGRSGQLDLLDFDEVEELVPELRGDETLLHVLRGQAGHLGQLRRMQDLLEDAYQLNQIKIKVIRSIRNQIMES